MDKPYELDYSAIAFSVMVVEGKGRIMACNKKRAYRSPQ